MQTGLQNQKRTNSVYKIEEGTHGFTLTFGGTVYSGELKRWLAESERALARRKSGFCVIVVRLGRRRGRSSFADSVCSGTPAWCALR